MKISTALLFLALATSASAFLYNQDTTYINSYPTNSDTFVYSSQYGLYYRVGNIYGDTGSYYTGYIPYRTGSCIGSGCGKSPYNKKPAYRYNGYIPTGMPCGSYCTANNYQFYNQMRMAQYRY